jgi:hypothetical protein
MAQGSRAGAFIVPIPGAKSQKFESDFLQRRVHYIVMKPAAALGEDIGSVGADLFSQLTQRRLARGFARVNAALWHLPLRQPRRHPDAVTNEG